MISSSYDSNGGVGKQIVKIIMVGAPKSGKSSLMNCYNDLDFDSSYVPTSAGDFTAKEIEIDKKDISAQIWDVGGAGILGKSFLRGTHGVLLVADMTSEQSLKVLNSLYENVKRLVGFADDCFPCVVVANKLDIVLSDNGSSARQISLDALKLWASARRVDGKTPISIFEVSAKDGTNVDLMFETLFRMALNKPGETMSGASAIELSPSTDSPAQTQSSHPYRAANTPTEPIEGDMGGDTASEEGTSSVRKGKGEEEGDFFANEEEQAIAKVVIAGAASVGKTFILKRFVGDDKDTNNYGYEPTIGADLRIVDIPVKDRILTLQIWDTSGNPKMLAMGRSIYRDADCLVLVYDITSMESFNALESYWDHYLANADPFEPEEFPVLLVGNKCDLSDRRGVTLEEVMEWCALRRPRRPITYIECSALCSMGVSDIFVFVADAIYDYALAADTMQDTDEDDQESEEYSSEDSFTSGADNDPMYGMQYGTASGRGAPAGAGRHQVQPTPRRLSNVQAEKTCWANPFSLFCS